MSAFEELGVMPELIKAIEGQGWLCAPAEVLLVLSTALLTA